MDANKGINKPILLLKACLFILLAVATSQVYAEYYIVYPASAPVSACAYCYYVVPKDSVWVPGQCDACGRWTAGYWQTTGYNVIKLPIYEYDKIVVKKDQRVSTGVKVIESETMTSTGPSLNGYSEGAYYATQRNEYEGIPYIENTAMNEGFASETCGDESMDFNPDLRTADDVGSELQIN